ncbi:endothelin-converting enzyme 1 isoform X1 [Chironomus tepperi]|uniref:endothelin-converting enzyme 1 isoform X1 n=2 Tax=Chironomus tepperi TaxID=113505 RepID=UPI00391F2C36
MTAETSTTISSISGGNLNSNKVAISGNQNAQKRGFHLETDKIENLQLCEQQNNTSPSTLNKIGTHLLNWIFCGPCIQFLKTSTTFHKMTLTGVTLIVTSLLVASPILFLISAAPSMPHSRDGCSHDECGIHHLPPVECTDIICKNAAASIQAKINWKIDVCKDFKSFSCSNQQNSLRAIKSPQEIADNQMLQLLSQNTTSGAFRKLGRLYESCLRQELNSSSIRLTMEKLGGYMPINALGPSTVMPLLLKMKQFGAPLLLLDIYYDLSYGRRPQVLLIIDIPPDVHYILQNIVRFHIPKAPLIKVNENVPKLLDEVLKYFLPSGLSNEQRESERQSIHHFVRELNQIRRNHIDRDFSNSFVVNNISALMESYPFLNWLELLPMNWNGPIVLRSPMYLRSLKTLLMSHPNRIIHNSLLMLFVLNALPHDVPAPLSCTKATMSLMPEASSSLFMSQFTDAVVRDAIARSNIVFDLLKAHLKRAPSLRGAALVRLASLKMQAEPWPPFYNITQALSRLNELEITSDNWFENVLRIYEQRKTYNVMENVTSDSQTWAYPIISRAFYDPLSHKIVVPLSLILVPFFHPNLPPYLHFSTVGMTIAKEILRSVTKAFEDKAMRCVPTAVEVFSNSSRMELLITSGGMQIAYHSMLALNGMKSMARLPGLNLSSTQIFFLVTAQELCSKSQYEGVETDTEDFHDILFWLIAQGGTASQHFQCQYGTTFRLIQNCGIW